ncbi:MAG TPA: response regulator transcription factor [Bryobacteraceae bacterium]|nr:response regulator transcription factor [Bryobacteraceae bacterium]
MTKPITVLLADDHDIVIEGLRRVLKADFQVVGVAADGPSLVAEAARLKPDVIVVDISMPLLNGIEAVRQIRLTDKHAKVVFVSMHPDVVYVSEALAAGGSAYVLKSSAGTEILSAIKEALRDGTYLSPAISSAAIAARLSGGGPPSKPPTPTRRQREVIRLTAMGCSTNQIGEALRISPRTVEFHRYQAMDLLGLHTIAELIQYAMKHHMV